MNVQMSETLLCGTGEVSISSLHLDPTILLDARDVIGQNRE